MKNNVSQTVTHPKGTLKIVNKIDDSKIMGPEDSGCYYYKYQEYYALTLWALQEKYGFTFEEATLFCGEIFRFNAPEFFELIFGLDFDEYCEWYDYLHSLVSYEDIAHYTGKVERNLYEGNQLQWF